MGKGTSKNVKIPRAWKLYKAERIIVERAIAEGLSDPAPLSNSLAIALKRVADFDPYDTHGEGWRSGWCWCGGSKKHTDACSAARVAMAIFDLAAGIVP